MQCQSRATQGTTGPERAQGCTRFLARVCVIRAKKRYARDTHACADLPKSGACRSAPASELTNDADEIDALVEKRWAEAEPPLDARQFTHLSRFSAGTFVVNDRGPDRVRFDGGGDGGEGGCARNEGGFR